MGVYRDIFMCVDIFICELTFYGDIFMCVDIFIYKLAFIYVCGYFY
jgi:hypothetical protein